MRFASLARSLGVRSACGTTAIAFPSTPGTRSANVADFSPFAGVRYQGAAAAELAALVAPPYDVIDDDQRATLEAADEHNSVRLILPRDVDDRGRSLRPGRRHVRPLARRAACSSATPQPRFYAYRMEFTDPHGVRRHTRGVIGALTLPEPGDDDVLPHERTLPKAKSDRLALLRAMRVNVDPIWGLTLGSGLTALLDGATPLASCVDPDGVRHEIAAIDDPETIAAIRAVVGSAPLVLADGHHRFETALNYRNELRAAAAPTRTAPAAIMTFVVELVDDELCIEPIHRLIDVPRRRRRPGPARRRVRRARRGREHARRRRRARRRRCAPSAASGIVDGRGLALAVPRADVRAAALAGEHPGRRRDRRRGHRGARRPPARGRDLAVPPRRPGRRRARRQGRRDRGRSSARRCRSPTTRAAAVDRVRMPQKTTFFWPKPRTGMVFRTLD